MKYLNQKSPNFRSVASKSQPRCFTQSQCSRQPQYPKATVKEIVPLPLLPKQCEIKDTKAQYIKNCAKAFLEANIPILEVENPQIKKLQYVQKIELHNQINAIYMTTKHIQFQILNLKQQMSDKRNLIEKREQQQKQLDSQLRNTLYKDRATTDASGSQLFRMICGLLQFKKAQLAYDLAELECRIAQQNFQLQTNLEARQLHSQIVVYDKTKNLQRIAKQQKLKVAFQQFGNVPQFHQLHYQFLNYMNLVKQSKFDFQPLDQQFNRFIDSLPLDSTQQAKHFRHFQEKTQTELPLLYVHDNQQIEIRDSLNLLQQSFHVSDLKNLSEVVENIFERIRDRTKVNLDNTGEFNDLYQNAVLALQQFKQPRYYFSLLESKQNLKLAIKRLAHQYDLISFTPIQKIDPRLASDQALIDQKNQQFVRVLHMSQLPSLNELQIQDIDMHLCILLQVMKRLWFLQGSKETNACILLDQLNNFYEQLMQKFDSLPSDLLLLAKKHQLRLISIRMQNQNAQLQQDKTNKRKQFFNNLFERPIQSLQQKTNIIKEIKAQPTHASPKRITQQQLLYNKEKQKELNVDTTNFYID